MPATPDSSPQSIPSAEPAQLEQADATYQHRRETWLYIALPMLVGALVWIGLLSLALLLPLRAQVSLVADFMSIILCLCPAAICIFPIYVLMMVIAFGMNKVHDGTERPLKRIESMSHTLADKTNQTADSINRKSIAVASKFALLDKVWDLFDQTESNGQATKEKTDDDTRTQ